MQLQPLQKMGPDQSDYSSIEEDCVVSMGNFTVALQKVKPSVSEKVGLTQMCSGANPNFSV